MVIFEVAADATVGYVVEHDGAVAPCAGNRRDGGRRHGYAIVGDGIVGWGWDCIARVYGNGIHYVEFCLDVGDIRQLGLGIHGNAVVSGRWEWGSVRVVGAAVGGE